MSELIESLERRQMRELPPFRIGDRVRVHFQVIEGTRRRTQVFEGVVIRLQGSGSRRTFAVRKISFGVGVERTFPLHSPKIERLEIMGRGEVRRAKLYYLRGRVGRRARLRERRDFNPEEFRVGAAATPEPTEAAADDAAASGADGAESAAAQAQGASEPEAGTEAQAEADGAAAEPQAEPEGDQPQQAEEPQQAEAEAEPEAEAPSGAAADAAAEPVADAAAAQPAEERKKE